MKFDQDFIQKVREANNIVDLISQHVELKKAGGGFVGLCPFHGEKSPSFSVSEDKQLYHCFGCKASGTVIHFVQDYQGLTFIETIEYLAKRAGIALPVGPTGSRTSDKKELLYRINDLASSFFQQELFRQPDTHPAWEYLKKRGISREIATKFRLGFAPNAWTSLADALERKKAPLYLAKELGLVKNRDEGKTGYFDLFRNRIIFPIYSPNDSCLGFGGRVLDASMPKYLNSPDSVVFHKGQVFYGLDFAAKHIRSADMAILVEGYTDWIALVKAGFPNVVATLGTAFTSFHANLLKRYCTTVTVLFDGDKAGQFAARRSLPMLLTEGLHPKGVMLPFELDPDEFLDQQGPSALKVALDRSLDLYDLILEDEAKQNVGDPTDKVQMLDRLGEILLTVPDARLRALYIQNTASYLNIDPKLVQHTLRALSVNVKPKAAAPVEVSAAKVEAKPEVTVIEVRNPPRSELDLLNVALLKEKYLKEILASDVISRLKHPGLRAIFAIVVDAYGQMSCKFDNLTALLISQVKPSDVVTRQLAEPLCSLSDDAAKKLIHDCIKRIRETDLRSQSRALVTNLRGAQGDEQKEKLEQIMNIHRNRRQLNQEN